MANATVEKIQALGLRHGEKVVVALAAVLCLVFLATAFTKEPLNLTPDDVKNTADRANSNINKKQDEGDVLKRLEDEFLKKPDFEVMVDKQAKNLLVADNYRLNQPWVTLEPGAGLLRDMPELIAVSELYAYPGRGGFPVWARDAEGNKIPDVAKPEPDDSTKKRRKRNRRGGGGLAGMMGAGSSAGGMPGMPGATSSGRTKKGSPKEEEEEKREIEAEKRRIKSSLAGKGKSKDKESEKSDEEDTNQNFKETVVGKRWVVLTGTIDHKKLRDNYLLALKRPELAHPHYKRLEVQRQVHQPDGSWSDWEPVDSDANLNILDNLPETEPELTPETVRIDDLVDPLPFLKAGYWERVHIASLVPEEKTEAAAPAKGPAGSSANSSAGMGAMMKAMSSSSPGMPGSGSMPGSSKMSSSAGMGMPGMPGMSGGSGPMGGLGGGGGGEAASFPTTEADAIMIRSLDFTVEPDTSYRYRVRIVVYNPNKDREDVSPGVDVKSTYLFGPWSEPTDEATMPADVSVYALQTSRTGKNNQVHFQVTRWDPTDGLTVVKDFDAGPGEIVGDTFNTPIPNPEGKGSTKRPVDFVSRQLVVDVAGGSKPLPSIGVNGPPFKSPASSILLRPDGSLLVRNEMLDTKDEVRRDIETNYNKELKESNKKRESSMGSNSSSAAMMQMMGAGGSSSRPTSAPRAR